jgi:hypothetical protein
LENNTGDFFKIIDDTKLRLISAIDYEKYKTKSVDVRVTDAAGHEYVETVTITITDVNDSQPSHPKLSTLTIVEGTAANTQIATASATDPSTKKSITNANSNFIGVFDGRVNHFGNE